MQASKQVGKKPPEGCSCESEVVTRNALEIGCNGKRWKRGSKRVISRLTTEWGVDWESLNQICTQRARVSNQVPRDWVES